MDESKESRLRRLLDAAFSGPPTPLKNIPKKSGKSRAIRGGAASAANARTAKRRSGKRA
jgi:hypothetical protein